MFYITGDKHGNYFNLDFDLVSFCNKLNTTKDDVLIILGDAGINYYVNPSDEKGKKYKNSARIYNLR